MILLTTSRRPTSRIRTFCNDLVYSIPNIYKINRGKLNQYGITEKATQINADRLIIIERWNVGAGKISFFNVTKSGLVSIPPILHVSRIWLRRELEGKKRGIFSSVITFESKNFLRLKELITQISKFLALSMMSRDKAITNHKVSMHFSFDSKGQILITFVRLNRMIEIGPRFSISR